MISRKDAATLGFESFQYVTVKKIIFNYLNSNLEARHEPGYVSLDAWR